MDAERWRRARALFDELVDTPREQWVQRLEAACPDDSDVRLEALALLAADADASTHGTGLADRVPDALADFAERDETAARDRLVGQRVGPYELVRELGRGGMGAVWLARRVDGEFEQQVAIKLIRPGWDADELLGRFRAERQILAGLTHPNIAHLLDGGVTVEGKPWLALEYIDGVDLRTYCDLSRLDLPARLRLFLTVCDAVAHAHTRLVVHRDLKPSNLLVTRDGKVKLLDFGIAKLVDTQAAHVSVMRVFTPEYAAPEQVRGELVTTSVDIYALGLLLYELLTGKRPYRAENSTPAAYERAILDQEPTRPSHAVTRNDDDEAQGDATAVAAKRHLTPQRLQRELRGDLDAIVLKALRKEPAQRYASVADLSSDLERYLDSRPVEARRGGWRYRAERFLRRHALAASLAVTAVLALVAGLGVALWQAGEARRQRDAARDESAKAAEVVGFLNELFRGADPSEAQRKDVTARELLDRGAERVRQEFNDQPAVRAELLHTMAGAYSGIGRPVEALALSRQTLELRRRLGDPRRLVDALVRTAALSNSTSDKKATHELLDEAERLLTQPKPPVDREGRLQLANVQSLRAVSRIGLKDKAEENAALLVQAVATRRELLGPADPDTQDAVIFLARMRGILGQLDAAQVELDALVSALRQLEPVPKDRLAEALSARATLYGRQKNYPAYERASREVVELMVAVHGPDAWPVAIVRHNLATALLSVGRYEEAVEASRAALAAGSKLLAANHSFLLSAQLRLGDGLAAMGRFREAEATYAEGLARHQTVDPAVRGSQAAALANWQARLAAVRQGTVPAEVAQLMPPR